MPDFSQSGSDGSLPDGFQEWQWGVTYTVRPELLAPLLCGREYRLITAVRRKIPKGKDFTGYGQLYQRAKAIATARIAELQCPAEAEPLHSWVFCHGWQRLDIGSADDLIIVFLTTGVVCPVE